MPIGNNNMLLTLLFLLTNPTVESVPEAELISIQWSVGGPNEVPEGFKKLNANEKLPFKGSCWVELKLRINQQGNYVITGGNRYMQNMAYYGYDRTLLANGNNYEATLQQGIHTFYIFYPFIDFKARSAINVSVAPAANYYKEKLFYSSSHVLFISIIVFLFLLSIAFYTISKGNEIIYLFYAWYLFSIVFFFAYQFGMLGQWFPFVNHIAPVYWWISSASLSMSYLFFAGAFLDLRKTDPIANKVVTLGKWFVLSVVIIETTTYIFGYDIQHSIIYKSIVVLFQVIAMPYLVIRIVKQRTTLSWIFIGGASILIITTLAGQVASTFKAVDITNFYIQIGLLIEVFIFSVGIGIRMWLINKQKGQVQQDLLKQMQQNLAIHRKYTTELEEKVLERTKDLQIKNEEKEVLLKEIHHRVKNNLQTIASLLNLQQRRLKDKMAIGAIEESKNRVKVMGLIHKFLYQQETTEGINLHNYLAQLVDMLIDSYNVNKKVCKKVEIDNITTDMDMAITLGLILNELITNSLKHAFENIDSPELKLLVHAKGKVVFIQLIDNGNNISINVDYGSTGFGWKLVNSLVESLNGKINTVNKEGFEVRIEFPLQT